MVVCRAGLIEHDRRVPIYPDLTPDPDHLPAGASSCAQGGVDDDALACATGADENSESCTDGQLSHRRGLIRGEGSADPIGDPAHGCLPCRQPRVA